MRGSGREGKAFGELGFQSPLLDTRGQNAVELARALGKFDAGDERLVKARAASACLAGSAPAVRGGAGDGQQLAAQGKGRAPLRVMVSADGQRMERPLSGAGWIPAMGQSQGSGPRGASVGLSCAVDRRWAGERFCRA